MTWPTKIAHRLKDVPASPLEEPPLQTHVSQPHRMAGRFTFLSVRRRAMGRITDMTVAQRKWLTHWDMLVAVDNQGRMRWMRKLDRRAAGIEHLASGNLFVHDTESCSREIDVAGNVTRAWFAAQRPQGAEEGGIPVDVRGLHHQPRQMPNGKFLALSAHAGRVKVWPASVREPDKHKADREIVGDMVVEFTPEGEVVWSWDSFDHPDPDRIGHDALDAYWHVRGFPGAADWTHGNGVAYDESDDSVLVSLRLQDCILKIDRLSGETVWILGDHDGWPARLQGRLLAPIGENFRWPWHLHNPRVTSEGTIMLFDNGIHGARPGQERVAFHESFSRGVEYSVDRDAMSVEQVWSSALTDADAMERTWAMGDAHRLEDSDTALVIHSIAMPHGRDDIGMDEDDRSLRYVSEFPFHARSLEYNRKDIRDIVFDMTVRDENDLIHWEVFSGMRVDSLHPKGSGIKLDLRDALLPERAA
ncbi:MAG: aryl-sulfate sulfotransferase [Boseongicola sp.]|nr:aryl-sulfate sulfotransferase [Boseongicola sp.]